ncbi:MAG: threonine-phosphate decarboxylase CobD [Rhizobiaceae bacterium]
MIEHGGALDLAIEKFGGAKADWLDLSTGINPVAYPVPDLPGEVWQRLPDAGLESAAIAAARAYYGFGANAGVAAAPGTQALIQLYPHLAAPGNAMVIGPTYEEHAQALGLAGRDVRYERALSSLDDEDMIVALVNPNNPDGKTVPADAILFAAERLAERGGLLVVDEAFADCDGADSVAAHAGMDGLLVLKSFGKFFGLAGARLGFAAGTAEMTGALGAMLGPWATSGPALAVAGKAYADTDWIDATRQRLKADRKALVGALTVSGLQVVGGTDLFVTARHFQAAHIWRELAARHILARKFDYAADWLRFGLPADDAGIARLEHALSAIMAEL